MELTIVQQNLDAFRARNDRFRKNNQKPMTKKQYKEYVTNLMNRLLEEKPDVPDVLLLSEFCYNDDKTTIVERLERENYEVIFPDGFDKENDKNCYIVCILAIKKEKLKFTRIRGYEELAKPYYRYITGTLASATSGKEIIKVFFTHVPDTSRGISRMEEKARMLFSAYCFYIENRDGYAFLGGDFNSDENNNTSFLPIFKKLYDVAEDTEPKKENTYRHPNGKEKRFDYALASKSLAPKCTTELIPTIKECLSDHNGLRTTITL